MPIREPLTEVYTIQMDTKKPVCYLDVDDTLLRFPSFEDKAFWEANPTGAAAPGAGEFFRWLKRHFEVRWLTMWCTRGVMDVDRCFELAELLGVEPNEIREVKNPLAFVGDKTEGINWLEHTRDGRPWVWLEDDILPSEIDFLGEKFIGNWIRCNVSEHETRLVEVQGILTERFAL